MTFCLSQCCPGISIRNGEKNFARFAGTNADAVCEFNPYSKTKETHECLCGCGSKISNKSKAVLHSAACRQRMRRQRLEQAECLPGTGKAPTRSRRAKKEQLKAAKSRLLLT